MPLTVVATAGASNANSYVTRDDADSYFAGRAFTAAWTGTTEKDVALVMATSLLDALPWKGARGSTSAGGQTQALAWPRRWAPTLEAENPVENIVTDSWVDEAVTWYAANAIPRPIVRATCELALEILRAGTADPFTKDDSLNVTRKTVDVLTTEYTAPAVRLRYLAKFPAVMALIAPLLRPAPAANEVTRV